MIGTIRISQLPSAVSLGGTESFIVNQEGNTRQSTVNDIVGLVTYVSSSGIATVAEGLTGTPNLNVGVVTATSYYGNGVNLTGIVTSIEAGTGISIDQSTGKVTISNTGGSGGGISGVNILDDGSVIGIAATIDFGTGLSASPVSSGVVTVTSSGGGGGESYWVQTDVGIHTLSNVGVGTTNPTSTLTVGGDINLDDGGTYTTTLQMVTPTADRTISFPDKTGTIALVAGSNGQVTFNSVGVQSGGNLSYDVTAGTFGYGTGRGTIIQGTSKSTGVTLNAPCGSITMNGAALGADTNVSFTLTNSSISSTDVLILNHISGGTINAYVLNAQAASGSATINVRNVTAGSLSEAIVIAFAVIKS